LMFFTDGFFLHIVSKFVDCFLRDGEVL
jgi:hypothetical protein